MSTVVVRRRPVLLMFINVMPMGEDFCYVLSSISICSIMTALTLYHSGNYITETINVSIVRIFFKINKYHIVFQVMESEL